MPFSALLTRAALAPLRLGSASRTRGRLDHPMPDFRIQIERLTADPAPFEFEVGAAWWAARADASEAGDEEAAEVEEPFVFALQASRATSEDVLLDGTLAGKVGVECSRCGKRYSHRLREPFRLVLAPLKDGRAPDPEGERGLAENGVYLGEDLEVGAYRGAVVGLDDYFGEMIALAIPIQPLCEEDCLGLCAHCGAARTRDPDAACGCQDEKIESPFAVLAQLKTQQD